jgi:hypothetical protein
MEEVSPKLRQSARGQIRDWRETGKKLERV